MSAALGMYDRDADDPRLQASDAIISSVFGVVERPPLSLVSGSDRLSFYQCVTAFVAVDDLSTAKNNYVGDGVDMTVAWAHPALVDRPKYRGTSLALDCTARNVPKGFRHCLVLSVFDRAHDLLIPVFYVLCTRSTRKVFRNAMAAILGATKRKLDPESVVCDFDPHLRAAVKEMRPDVTVVGSCFHFKQACRRRMVKLGIPEREIDISMATGYLDMLVVIPRRKIAGADVDYVKRATREQCARSSVPYSESKWEQFWAYFRMTWLHKFPRGRGMCTRTPSKRIQPRWIQLRQMAVCRAIGSSRSRDLQNLNRESSEDARVMEACVPKFRSARLRRGGKRNITSGRWWR